jgi:plastocyanin
VTDLSSGRRAPPWRRPGPWLLAGLILGASAIPGGLAAAHLIRVAPLVGYGHLEAGMSANFTNVQMTDKPSYSPRSLNVSAVSGALEVNVRLNNTASALAHTFTVVNVSQSGIPVNRSLTPVQLTNYFATYPPTIAENVSAGKAVWANFSVPASTKFQSLEFVSTIPYQFQAGMWGFLNLTPAGPTYVLEDNATPTLSFVPNVLSTPTGVTGSITVHVHVLNTGNVGHTFTVSSQPNVTYASVGSLVRPHAPLSNASIPSSGSNWSNFTVPGIGVYEYICTVPGHFAGGMYGFLYVGVPVPPPPAIPSTAIAAVPVLIGSGILLGVGLFLTLSSAFVGRFPKPPSPGAGHHP